MEKKLSGRLLTVARSSCAAAGVISHDTVGKLSYPGDCNNECGDCNFVGSDENGSDVLQDWCGGVDEDAAVLVGLVVPVSGEMDDCVEPCSTNKGWFGRKSGEMVRATGMRVFCVLLVT